MKEICDFYYWFRSPQKVEFEAIVDEFVVLKSKQLQKVKLENPNLSFYKLRKFNFDKSFVENNWITTREEYLDKDGLVSFLFNEGDYEFSFVAGTKIGTVVLEKISFIEWCKNEKNRIWSYFISREFNID